MIPSSAKLFTDPQLLRSNLREYGWSPVQVDVSILSKMLQKEEDPSLKAKVEEEDDDNDNNNEDDLDDGPRGLLRQHRDWEALHEHMFEQTTFGPSVTHRRAESGSPVAVGSLTNNVEPKQSLELKRQPSSSLAVVSPCTARENGASTPNDEEENDQVQKRMNSWIVIFHAVAWTVANFLEWPDDTLIANMNYNSPSLTNNYCEGGDNDADLPPPMDLLRAFLYDVVPITTNQSDHDDASLGSSPHTDWGSLTVVWQDGVGGLETFCRQNESWVPVVPAAAAARTTETTIDDDDDTFLFLPLIIHIGDVTSLVLGNIDGSIWPSPLHRVRSPRTGQRRRRSLVYFCYPAPRAGSIQNLQRLFKGDDFGEDKVRLEQYSLLQNQSLVQGATQQLSNAKEVYDRIRHKPLVEVFMEKWSQVQR